MADLTRPSAAQSIYDACAQNSWPMTPLINSAGISRFGGLLSYLMADYEAILRRNALAPLELNTPVFGGHAAGMPE